VRRESLLAAIWGITLAAGFAAHEQSASADPQTSVATPDSSPSAKVTATPLKGTPAPRPAGTPPVAKGHQGAGDTALLLSILAVLLSLASMAASVIVLAALRRKRSNASQPKKQVAATRVPPESFALRRPASTVAPNVDPSPFVLEAMVAAGPRKDAASSSDRDAEGELCEDSVGFIVRNARWIFWLCDGTSGGHVFPRVHLGNETALPFRFSSRSLAQSVGETFAAEASSAVSDPLDVSATELMYAVFRKLEAEWQRRLAAYFKHVPADDTKTLLAALPRDAQSVPFARWSTTFLGGIFEEESRTLGVTSYGDSGLIVVATPHERSRLVEPNSRRLILTVTFPNAGPPQVQVHSGDDNAWTSYSSVAGFIAMSDGVTPRNASLNAFLPRVYANLGKFPLDRVREMLLELGYHSGDDKSIIFGRFLSRA
jgi:hypothetical protein